MVSVDRIRRVDYGESLPARSLLERSIGLPVDCDSFVGDIEAASRHAVQMFQM